MTFRVNRIDLLPTAVQGSPVSQASAALPRVELQIVKGKARQKRRPITSKVFLIGSAVDCDLVLGDDQFPAAYAYMYVQPDGVQVRRLGEGPELRISGKQVQTAALTHGDVLECGPYAFQISIRQSLPSPTEGKTPQRPVAAVTAPASDHLPSADDVLDLTVARSQVVQLLADIASTLNAATPPQILRYAPHEASEASTDRWPWRKSA